MQYLRATSIRELLLGCAIATGANVITVAHADCGVSNTNTCLGGGALGSATTATDNTAIGWRALANTDNAGTEIPTLQGNRNTATGSQSMFHNTSGYDNVAIGDRTLFHNLTGGQNVAIGNNALLSLTEGDANIAIGMAALGGTSATGGNIAIGNTALFANTAGENLAIGHDALRSNTAGSPNTAIGHQALNSNETGESNVALGDGVMYFATGSDNTAAGSLALYGLRSGDRNTAVGRNALRGYEPLDDASTNVGSDNTGIGTDALRGNEVGIGNTATGSGALRRNRFGSHNTAYGMGALRRTAQGSRNVGIGYQAGTLVNGSDNIVIGASNPGAQNESGAIRIGTATIQTETYIAGVRGVTTGLANATTVFIDGNGQLGTIKSSRAVKDDIQSMGNVSERLLALRPVTFRYKRASDDGSKPVQYGLIAEEVAQVFPELVVYDEENKPETVSYHLLAILLVNEFQKDHQQLLLQAEEIAQLKSQVAGMVNVVAAMQATQMTARDSD